jgi:hypothetical protein
VITRDEDLSPFVIALSAGQHAAKALRRPFPRARCTPEREPWRVVPGPAPIPKNTEKKMVVRPKYTAAWTILRLLKWKDTTMWA